MSVSFGDVSGAPGGRDVVWQVVTIGFLALARQQHTAARTLFIAHVLRAQFAQVRSEHALHVAILSATTVLRHVNDLLDLLHAEA